MMNTWLSVNTPNFLPHFHYNKDWNEVLAPLSKIPCATSYPTSIITRIETHY